MTSLGNGCNSRYAVNGVSSCQPRLSTRGPSTVDADDDRHGLSGGEHEPGGRARNARRRSGFATRRPRAETTPSARRSTTPSQIKFPALMNDASQLEPDRKWCTFCPCTTLMEPATMHAMPATLTSDAGPGHQQATRPPPRRQAWPWWVTNRAAPPQAAPMSNARGKRSQPRWRCGFGAGAPGKVRTAASNGTAGRSGGSGPPARVGARQVRPHPAPRPPGQEAEHQAEEQGRTRDGQRDPDLALRGPGDRTVKFEPPSACRSAAVTCQPLAKPSTSWGGPRSTACEPAGAPGPGWPPPASPRSRSGPGRVRRAASAPLTSRPVAVDLRRTSP